MSQETMKPFDFYLYKKGKISYATASYKPKPKAKPRTRDAEADKIVQMFWDNDTPAILNLLSEFQTMKKLKKEKISK